MKNEIIRVESTGLFPSSVEWAMMKEQALMLIKSNFLPDAIKMPEQAIAIMLKGREIGMPPMQSFAHISVIKGKPTMSAECMLAQIFKTYPATKLHYVQNDDVACILDVTKPGNAVNRFSFTYEDAQKAKLTNKENWNNYRRAMLRSRCVSEMARSLFPEALMGISYTPEELDDVSPAPAANMEQPKQITPEVQPEQPKPRIFDKDSIEWKEWIVKRLSDNSIPDGFGTKVADALHGKQMVPGILATTVESLLNNEPSSNGANNVQH